MDKLERKRINVSFDLETYDQIQNIAYKKHQSMSELVRDWAIQSLKTQAGADNIDLITSIMREQLKDVLKPSIERLAALSAKTCVQSGTAAYLTAEAIARFVPEDLQMDVQESYEAARKKAVEYTQRKID